MENMDMSKVILRCPFRLKHNKTSIHFTDEEDKDIIKETHTEEFEACYGQACPYYKDHTDHEHIFYFFCDKAARDVK